MEVLRGSWQLRHIRAMLLGINSMRRFTEHYSDKIKYSENDQYVALDLNSTGAQYSIGEQSLRIYNTSDYSLVRNWYFDPVHDEFSPFLRDYYISPDASKALLLSTDTTGKYINYITDTNSQDSVALSDRMIQNSTFSSKSSYFASSVVTSTEGLSKNYKDGALIEGVNTQITGWVNDSVTLRISLNVLQVGSNNADLRHQQRSIQLMTK